MQPRYPKATWRGNGGRYGDGQGWGPLPDRGGTVEQIRNVVHTTESTTLPGYDSGKTAPHTSYLASSRAWVQHVEHHRRAGTLVGSTSTGVLGNEIAVQTEIVAYSDPVLARKHGGLWVGDFTAGHYADLASYVAWCRASLFFPYLKLDRAYGPAKDFPTFLWGKADEAGGRDTAEMTRHQWLNAGGILTAHGAGPGQSHWDTGVLDLHRIIAESLPAAPPPVVVVPPATVTVSATVLAELDRNLAAALAIVRGLR